MKKSHLIIVDEASDVDFEDIEKMYKLIKPKLKELKRQGKFWCSWNLE